MGLFSRIAGMFSGASHDTHALSQLQLANNFAKAFIQAGYDAARTNASNAATWALADGLSADAANSPDVRYTLRTRCRMEVANNPVARGLTEQIAHDLVGTGPRPQIRGIGPDDARAVERKFLRWARSVRLAKKLRTMRKARISDGEAFAVLVRNPRHGDPVELDIRLVEADQVTTPDLRYEDPNSIDGIVFDQYGNPSEYHVLKQHPGDDRGLAQPLEYTRYEASRVLHWYREDRPGQSRGVPDLTPALTLFVQLRRWTEATIGAAETAASIFGTLETDASAQDPEVYPALDAIDLEPRAFLTMPAGYKLNAVEPRHPITSFDMFERAIVRQAARCVLVPVNLALGDSSDHNFASGKLDHLTYWRAIRDERADLELEVLGRIFRAWLEEAQLIEDHIPRSARTRDLDLDVAWYWDGPGEIDEQKAATARKTRLEAGTSTLADELARDGRDWEEHLEQLKREREAKDRLGLSTPQEPDQADASNAEETANAS